MPTRINQKTDSLADEATDNSENTRLERLQSLITARLDDNLSRLADRIENPQKRIKDIAEVLPHAIKEQNNNELAQALDPYLDNALQSSIQNNPKPIITALYPVIGSIIRKSLATALQGMLRNLKLLFEQSLSLRSFNWRIEAIRTGRPFSEIALLHSLEYQVEEAFLIHKETGLLLLHEISDQRLTPPDRDLVSGMLSAIKDFVKDSFSHGGEEELETFKVGSLTILVEHGPAAMLAVTVRGTPPDLLNDLLPQTLEKIHEKHSTELTDYNGDNLAFEISRPLIRECLTSKQQQQDNEFPYFFWLVMFAILAAGTYWIFSLHSEKQQWNLFIHTLNKEPGIVITTIREEQDVMMINVLRDPLARDPNTLLQNSSIAPEKVNFTFSPYLTLEKSIHLTRINKQLRPPTEVMLDVKDGVLTASGKVPLAWLVDNQPLFSFIPGITAFRAESKAVRNIIGHIIKEKLYFLREKDTLLENQQPALEKLYEALKQLDTLSRTFSDDFIISIYGHTDPTGTAEFNRILSKKRAEAIHELLSDKGLDDIVFNTIGEGFLQRDDMKKDPLAMSVTFLVDWKPSTLWFDYSEQ